MSLRLVDELVMVPAGAVRGTLVKPGDLRDEIGFQNDINGLLAALDQSTAVWKSESAMLSPHREPPRRRAAWENTTARLPTLAINDTDEYEAIAV